MAELKLSVEEIKELMDKMASANLGEFCVESEDFKLKIAAKKEQKQYVAGAYEIAPQVPVAQASSPVIETLPQAEIPKTIVGNYVKSPIVGTFYATPSPDKDAFVKVGQKVNKGDVLFIIESMKLMNEIQSEFDGEVLDICVENGQAVEFDQEIMIIG